MDYIKLVLYLVLWDNVGLLTDSNSILTANCKKKSFLVDEKTLHVTEQGRTFSLLDKLRLILQHVLQTTVHRGRAKSMFSKPLFTEVEPTVGVVSLR